MRERVRVRERERVCVRVCVCVCVCVEILTFCPNCELTAFHFIAEVHFF